MAKNNKKNSTFVILIVLLILIASFSGFKIISILSDYKKASDTYTEAEKNFVKKPEEVSVPASGNDSTESSESEITKENKLKRQTSRRVHLLS